MKKILVADSSMRDAQRFRSLIEEAGLEAELYGSGAEVVDRLECGTQDWAAIIILWEIPGPPFGSELVVRSRRLLPGVPVVVVSDALDATLATRAFTLGASDFLEKPLDMLRVKSCLDAFLNRKQSLYSHIVEQLNESILGDSPALLSTLQQVAKVIHHGASRVLLTGDSGTGKELLARAIHELGAEANEPFVAVNVAAIPKELSESMLFGHERGAFTGASDQHRGYMEEAGCGTLFLDELGELDLSLQSKLLRAIQEKKFRRVKGTKEIGFQAHLVCATNRDLAQEVNQGTFRRDLFHRIAEVTIQIPPLRERKGDVPQLLNYFLSFYDSSRQVRFARESLTILNSYPFPGNVRELENIVKQALIECEGDIILPQHLPLPTMGVFLAQEDQQADTAANLSTSEPPNVTDAGASSEVKQKLFRELAHALPDNWHELPYKQVLEQYGRALDRVYLRCLIERYHHNVSKATKAAGMDRKTFTQHWKDAGLPSLRADGGEADE
jgi:DNA-binding NtrC family response regulator